MDYTVFLADVLLVAVFALVVLACAKRGLVRAIAGILAWVLASALSLNLCVPVSEAVYDKVLSTRIQESLRENIGETGGDEEITTAVEIAMKGLPKAFAQIAESAGADTDDLLSGTNTFTGNDLVQSLEREFFRPLVMTGLKLLMFFVLLCILTALLSFLLWPVGRVVGRIPGINKADKVLGGILGVFKGVTIVVLLALVLKLLPSFVESEKLSAISENSKILAFVANSSYTSELFM